MAREKMMGPEELWLSRNLILKVLERPDWRAPASLAIVTGSGLGELSREVEPAARFDFADLPGLAPEPGGGVTGHALQWIIGRMDGVPIHLVAGRRHLYEGIHVDCAVAAVRLMGLIGVRTVLLTNAAGGLSHRLSVGSLMLIRDHINLMFRNPLVGPNVWPDRQAPGVRFPDLAECHDPAAGAILRRAALEAGLDLREGVYGAVLGPNYETRAEVEMLRRMGADAVGMSTVPEILAARHAGLRVAAISLITNSHVRRDSTTPNPGTTHQEVLAEGIRAGAATAKLIRTAVPMLARLPRSGRED